MSLPILVVLVILAVGAGALVGNLANRRLEEARETRGKPTAAQRIRDAATRSVVRLWKWNRERRRER